MNRTIISQDNSETLEAVTDKFRFALKKSFKGRLPEVFNQYQVFILDKVEVKRIRLEMDKWLLT